MNAKRISEIKKAISSNDVSLARKLISVALKNEPDADVYYLASQVALDDNQKKEFLNKALEIDPFHEETNIFLEEQQSGSKTERKSKNTNVKQSTVTISNKEVETFGVEIIICPSCKTINSTSNTSCINCTTLLDGIMPTPNPYLQIKQSNKEISISSTEDEPLLEYILSFPAWVRISIGLISGLIIGTIANSVTGYNPNATGWALFEIDFVPIYTIIFGISGLILSTRKNPLAFIASGFLLGGIIGGSIGGGRDGSTDGFFLLGAFGVLVGTIASRAFTWFSLRQDNLKQPQTVEQNPTLTEKIETNVEQKN